MTYSLHPLGEICDILDSKRKPITKKDRVAGPYPYYGATGILDHVENYIFDEKLVLIGEDGAKWDAGEHTAFAADGKYWVNNHAHVIRPHRDTILDQWIIYFLNYSDLTPFVTGLTVPKLNQAKLRSINIPVPPLEEQKRIVAILDEAFAGIEKAQANAQKNLANARELFESCMNTIFTQKGEGWKEKKLDDIAYLAGRIGWKGLTAKEYTKEGPLFISVHSLNYGDYVDFRDANHITQERYDESPEIMLQPDDVLICKDGAGIGKMGIIKELPGPTTINSSLLLIRSLKDIHPKYLYRALCSQLFQKLVKEKIDGATTPHLYQREIKQFLVPVPPLKEQKKISDRLDGIGAETVRMEAIYKQKLKNLAELKQSLLQKAFSGELTTSSSENVIPFIRPMSKQPHLDTTSPEFGAFVIAYGYHRHEAQSRNMSYGRVKAQKFLHFSESVTKINLGRFPQKMAAGPHDEQHMSKCQDWAKENSFFEFIPRNGSNGYKFKKLVNYNRLIDKSINAVKPYCNGLEKILALIMPMNTEEAGVLATVHAAWNNLLLDNTDITDNAIIHEAQENWTESKRNIPESAFRQAIQTIRNNDIVPDGTAKRVTGQENMF